MAKQLFYILPLLLFSMPSFSQDIEKLGDIFKAQPLKFSGGLSFDQIYAPSQQMGGDSAQPYQFFVAANLNTTIFEQITLPLTFSYSNRTFNKNYPISQESFNRFGMSPYFRWIKVHAGWRNMSFGKYSLSGHSFLGGGLELTPGNIQLKIMHGRLLKPIELHEEGKPAYLRMASGLQFNYSTKGNIYGFSVFRSADDYASLEKPLDSLAVLPEENFVYTFTIKQKVNKRLSVNFDWGYSFLTADSRVDDVDQNFFNSNVFVRSNSSTKKYKAFNAGVDYALGVVKIGAGYERIDPGYSAHGAYFYNNDFENITLSMSSPLFKKKVQLSASGGLERDNLYSNKSNSSKRLIGQTNVNWSVNQNLQLGGSYSNFQNTTLFNPNNGVMQSANPYDEIDSMKFVQVSQNASLNANYSRNSESLQQSYGWFGSYMNTQDTQKDTVSNLSNFYSSSFNYNLMHLATKISAGASVNFSWSQSSYDTTGTIGPAVNTSISYFENKGRTGISYSYNGQIGKAGSSQTVQLNSSLNVKKHHSFTFTALWLRRSSPERNRQPEDSAAGRMKIASSYSLRLGYRFKF